MNAQYDALRRKIVLIMAAAALIPLLILAALNYAEFQAAFTREAQTPFRSMVGKGKNSFEMFLAERSSTVSFIASVYSYAELADADTMKRIFAVMQKEFSGFVDLGLINDSGLLVNYVGPHKELQGVDYSGQDWFHKVKSRNLFISEVFEGFRRSPHMVVAVRHSSENGQAWIVRATIDTVSFNRMIAAMNLEPGSDAFLVNRQGILQSDSMYYGKALDKISLPMPAPSYESNVLKTGDSAGNSILLAYSYFSDANFVLMAVKPLPGILHSWFMLRTDLLIIFCAGALGIYFAAARGVGQLIARLRESDEKREQAILQMEHSQKLSSIGRLAAGVAHEINNPLAIINEKSGLLSDYLEMEPDFPRRESFSTQISAISAAVARCRDITQRMLGFARRMDVKIEALDINAMLKETLLFLEKEASYRKVSIVQELDPNLPKPSGDRGQMQQVFLNVLSNALAAVDEGGQTIIRTYAKDEKHIAVEFADNGCGMDEATMKHIFEPFYTTKKEGGTGLGMFITYGIVKRCGGEIEVDSEVGRGTVMTVILPLRQNGEC